ncbi:MAG TPA: alpha/beta hydrolase [Pseudonocardia sp.]|uniref:alpha/beta fold hydrolase n=1 Tax=Pseudonocardia sp. TaxID=60912 RepID=UPI002B7296A6|nr:alpha/beta hydrolase [Pseudonocardia sp.]HTF54005.1 alpha/beta hydrolase [Pseudonocardia sp.]
MTVSATAAESVLVETPYGRVHVTDTTGKSPALVLMHGFPDDSRIYNQLTPHLAARRAVSIDFHGFGRSDRPTTSELLPGQRETELAAVLDARELDQVVLVGHDASGPVAIDYTLSHPTRIKRLVLMNTYYGHADTLRLPEMIRLFADPDLSPLADAIVAEPQMIQWLLAHTLRQFGYPDDNPPGVAAASIIPQFFGDADAPHALTAIRAWIATVFTELAAQDRRIATGALKALTVPVTIAFGADDTYLNPDLAQHLAGLFGHADLHLIDDANHWPQWDQPERTAQLILEHSERP